LEVLSILDYFEAYLKDEYTTLELGLEWIRCQKIRLEYKKYLITAQYPHDDFNLAVDDCIFLFFIEYDRTIRDIFVEEIHECELSALYEIFFTPYEGKIITNILKFVDEYKQKSPTIFIGNKKFNTSIFTLRLGLSNIIKSDYEKVLTSRKSEQITKEEKFQTVKKKPEPVVKAEFIGTQIERLVRTYCFNQKIPETKDFEISISSFLTSYFKFGTFYRIDDFKDDMIISLSEYIYSGFTDKAKDNFTVADINAQFSEELKKKLSIISEEKALDGIAWKNDLSPVIQNFLKKFLIKLLEPKKSVITRVQQVKKIKEEKVKEQDEFSIDSIWDLNLDEEKFREKLEKLLDEKGVGTIQKRNIMRIKVQEFLNEKRKIGK